MAAYSPELRKGLGVYYTPKQIVRYMVEKVDEILTSDFQTGLLDNSGIIDYKVKEKLSKNDSVVERKQSVPKVAILDPATGTGTFMEEVLRYAHRRLTAEGKAHRFVEEIISSKHQHPLLTRMVGFELMMTSYIIAHLKLRRTYMELAGGYVDIPASERELLTTNILLTNTLSPPPHIDFEYSEQLVLFDFAEAIQNEANKANTWKAHRPIKVIIGNPPYYRSPTNKYDLSAYELETDGLTPLREAQHGMNNDYVKFFRFAEHIIDKHKEGILAFVTDSGYLDNRTFRGMRASLLRTFDKIFILNLHGNSRKTGKTEGGSVDENVFNIQQGVAIFIGVKTSAKKSWATVEYCDLKGSREEKLSALSEKRISFKKISVDTETASFIPLDVKELSAYRRFVGVDELFTEYINGMSSSRDGVAYAFTCDELKRRVSKVIEGDDDVVADLWGKFCRGQSAHTIRKDALSAGNRPYKAFYRPFDERWTLWTGKANGWMECPRGTSMSSFLNDCTLGENVGLVFGKLTSSFSVLATKHIVNRTALSAKSGCTCFIAPLYLYSENKNGIGSWAVNINGEAFDRITEFLKVKPEPIDVFDYVYGILHDPVYIERYGEFLKKFGIPRVPVIAGRKSRNSFYVSEKMYKGYVDAGRRLRILHTADTYDACALSNVGVISVQVKYNTEKPDLFMSQVKYKDGKLFINTTTSITSIPENVWNYCVGDIQVLDSWFKARKGKDGSKFTGEYEDHISAVVGIISETIEIQEKLRLQHDN